jgi:hypothetical protein
MTEDEHNAILRYDAACKAHPDWADMMRQQFGATMTAALRNYPYSYLPERSIMNWIMRLDESQ